jgi:predicted Zn finger-like uncharacterized protein
MDIAFSCETCGHQFQVDESLAGRKVKCKRCGHVFIIPGPGQSPAGSSRPMKAFGADDGSGAAGSRPIGATTRASRPGAASPPPARPPYGPSDPYAIDDDPYAIADEPPPPRGPRGLQDDDDFLPAGELVPVRAKMGMGPKKKPGGGYEMFDPIPGIFFLYLLGVVAVLGLWALIHSSGMVALACALAFVGLPLLLYGELGLLVKPFYESALHGLACLFVPIYPLYYLITRWSIMRGPFLNTLAGLCCLAIPMGIVVRFADSGEVVERAQVTQQVPFPEPTQASDPFGRAEELPPPGFPVGSRRTQLPTVEGPGRGDVRPNAPRPVAKREENIIVDVVEPTERVPNPEQGQPVETDFVTQALSDLNAGAAYQRKQALGRLMRAPGADARRVEVAKAIEPLLRDPDPWTRTDAAKALAVWGGKENTPALIGALNDSQFGVVWAVLDTFKALHDPAAAAAVAGHLGENRDRGKAVEALKAMGPEAEPAVIKYLNHTDVFVRMEAAKILKVIGGSDEGKAALYALLRRTNGNGLDAMAANDALRTLGPPKASAVKKRKSIVPRGKR